MAQTLDKPLELSQDILAPEILAPSTHPPIIFPPGSLSRGAADTPVLGFAPAPTVPADRAVPADQTVPADRPAPLVRPRRPFRMGWYETAIITLILSCGTLCIYRLIWAIQP